MGRNVDVSGSDLPERLRTLREQKRLTQADLAGRAGLSYRTILDLERGRRARVQVKTLMLLSAALDVPYEDLCPPDADASAGAAGRPQARRRRWPWAALAGVAVLAVAVAIVLDRLSSERVELSRDATRLTARDHLLGLPRWRCDLDAPVRFCEPSPRDDRRLLVGLSGDSVAGGRLLALDRETGVELWEAAPDLAAVARAFGEDVAYSANYVCTNFAAPDLDGDGRPELVVRFCNALWYPNVLCFVDPEGRVTSQYSHKGHVYDLAVVDLDGDGDDELVAAGTNNTPAYQGATVFVLDDAHRTGASVDAEAAPGSAEPDSALVRVVFPHFPAPYMARLGCQRLEADHIRSYRTADGSTRLSVTVSGGADCLIVVNMDAELHPLSSAISDASISRLSREAWPDSLVDGAGPVDEAWRETWLSTCLRFEAGHWPPPLPATP